MQNKGFGEITRHVRGQQIFLCQFNNKFVFQTVRLTESARVLFGDKENKFFKHVKLANDANFNSIDVLLSIKGTKFKITTLATSFILL